MNEQIDFRSLKLTATTLGAFRMCSLHIRSKNAEGHEGHHHQHREASQLG